MKRYYFIVGEASGDLHAANLIKELSALDNNATFQGFGGERMQKEGLELTKHYQEMAFMGFWEVLMNLSAIRKNFKQAKKELLEYNPDVLVLVDYPGFNMRMATFAKKHNIKVVYYITPQVWAWKESRVKKLKILSLYAFLGPLHIFALFSRVWHSINLRQRRYIVAGIGIQ